MSKHYMAIPFLSMLLGGICLSLSPGYNNRDNNPPNYPQDIKPGISDDSSNYQQYRNQEYRYKRIAYMDERDQDIHRRANRRGDWNYKQNWRYDREAFFRGDTQGEAYEEEHPEGTGGIGIDPDREFLQMRQFYLEQSRIANQNAHRFNNRPVIYSNNNQNQASQHKNANNDVASHDNADRNSHQRNQNQASQNKDANNRYRPNNFDNNAIADNYFDQNRANKDSKYNASNQNNNENNSNSSYHSDRTPRYYYYYE